MEKKENIKITIMCILALLICLFLSYKVINYYSSKNSMPIGNSEINLGEGTCYCNGDYYLNNCKCYDMKEMTGPYNSISCANNGGYWLDNSCYPYVKEASKSKEDVYEKIQVPTPTNTNSDTRTPKPTTKPTAAVLKNMIITCPSGNISNGVYHQCTAKDSETNNPLSVEWSSDKYISIDSDGKININLTDECDVFSVITASADGYNNATAKVKVSSPWQKARDIKNCGFGNCTPSLIQAEIDGKNVGYSCVYDEAKQEYNCTQYTRCGATATQPPENPKEACYYKDADPWQYIWTSNPPEGYEKVDKNDKECINVCYCKEDDPNTCGIYAKGRSWDGWKYIKDTDNIDECKTPVTPTPTPNSEAACYYKDADPWKYIWTSDPPEGYEKVDKSDKECINGCYCKEDDPNTCGIYAKGRSWDGWKYIKDTENIDECKPTEENACYAESTNSGTIYHWTKSPESSWTKTERSEAQCVNCYGNGSYLSLSSKACVQGYSSSACPNVFPNITNMDECKVIQDPSICKPTDILASKVEKATDVCEDKIDIEFKEGKGCEGNSVYTIDCDVKATTLFDYKNDGVIDDTSKISIFPGQGFAIGLNVLTTKVCTAKFNGNTWKVAYNTINNKIKQVEFDCGKKCTNEDLLREYNRLLTILDDIKDIVKGYNSYTVNDSFEESTSISIVGYKINGKDASLNNSFVSKVIDEGEGEYSDKEEVKLGVDGLTNPSNYTWSNTSKPRKVKMIPSPTYFDTYLGKESTDGLDGGNNVYIDYYTDVGEYQLNITSLGIGGSKNSVTNDKCFLNVKEEKLLYRPIDVKNPFINSSWKKGVNWINDEYDFTKTIKANTWTSNSLYSIYLTSEQVADLKSSTASNRDQYPYYGLCTNPSVTNRDNITQYICQIIGE